MKIEPVFCRGCGEKLVYLKSVKTEGKYVPVETKSLDEEDKTSLNKQIMINFDSSRHVNHFITCPKRDDFRKMHNKVKPHKDDLTKLYGYFVFLNVNGENKIQSKIYKKRYLAEECREKLQKVSPNKFYKIGTQKIITINKFSEND